jgi:hypothetical protein
MTESHGGNSGLREVYDFWGIIAVTEVTVFEAALLVQSHCSHVGGFILASVEA